MEEKTIVLNQYEHDALKTSIARYILILDDQIFGLKNAKHLSNEKKKDLHNQLGKTRDLLKGIIVKLN